MKYMSIPMKFCKIGTTEYKQVDDRLLNYKLDCKYWILSIPNRLPINLGK